MSQTFSLHSAVRPLTDAVRRALAAAQDSATKDDLLFLERWELMPVPGAAAALRVTQIRRANPELAAAVRAEVAKAARHPFGRG